MARVSAGSRRTTTEDFTMIRSLSTIRSLVAIACMAVATAATAVWGAVRAGFAIARSWIHDISPISIKQPKPKCRAALVQPKAFVTRLAKRDRPTVMARWRMCPST
jgi:hypothetical protein